MKILILTLLLSTNVFAENIKVHVPGMVCQMCVQGMQKQFGPVVKNATKDVIVNLDDKTVQVSTINPISDDDIKERVRNAGYNVSKIIRLDNAEEKVEKTN